MGCRPALVWGGVLAAGLAAEAHALLAGHHDCTLSALTRKVCRTEHPAGRVAFILGSAALAGWFQYHIVTWKRNNDESQTPRSGSRRRPRPRPDRVGRSA